ncbi:carboxylesterase family protein [Pseudomonas sp. B21-056]|uniref:carboxylesterase/lipase family protein n=1 Tax=Pseudomonas sp. B21-056 TaxID=2895495 RepID=UPI002230303D|nr:carboxylesterase family protein [Pseudomonas sp. B21-056]UZE25977.1 carboxylesterase family protein [Pseudomonas sp. B21-056]
MKRKLTMAALLILASYTAHSVAFAEEECTLCTNTESGTVQGHREDGVVSYKGIPYAAAPREDLRFRPPQPVKPWDGILDAAAYKPNCPQVKDPLEEYPNKGRTVTMGGETVEVYDNEDCLYLNVWTPAADQKKRPIMVFIHGGAFVVGSASSDFYNGKKLANRDVVVVTFNYRLGLFGFLELGELDSRYSGSGNNGLGDQIAAIQWVKRNASSFGGDPDNITVFGESAGSASVTALLATEKPANLFKRAIAQSGAANIIHSPEVARQASKDILAAGKFDTMDKLLESSAEELLSAQQTAYAQSEIGDRLFAPFIDGHVIKDNPNTLISAGNAKGISLMAGANQNEMNYWSIYDSKLRNMFTDETDFGPASPLIAEHYRKALEDKLHGTLDERYSAIMKETNQSKLRQAQNDDFIMIQPMRKMVEYQQPHNPNVYLYRFKWKIPEKYLPAESPDLGAVHALEIPFVFGNLDFSWVPGGQKYSEDPNTNAKKLSEQMMTAWTNFARTGNPNGNGVPAWPEYDLSHRRTMIWDNFSSSTIDPDSDRRKLWDQEVFNPL